MINSGKQTLGLAKQDGVWAWTLVRSAACLVRHGVAFEPGALWWLRARERWPEYEPPNLIETICDLADYHDGFGLAVCEETQLPADWPARWKATVVPKATIASWLIPLPELPGGEAILDDVEIALSAIPDPVRAAWPAVELATATSVAALAGAGSTMDDLARAKHDHSSGVTEVVRDPWPERGVAQRPSERPRDTDWLTIRELAVEYRISLSAAYSLGRYIPRHRAPGFGLRFLRQDVEDHLRRHAIEPGRGLRLIRGGGGRMTPRSILKLGDPRRHGL